MHGTFRGISFRIAAICAAGFFAFHAVPAHAGSADNVKGWLWSGTIGWIALNCSSLEEAGVGSCASGAGPFTPPSIADFGVNISEAPGFGDRGDFSGYAWSETAGWICFGQTCTGTTPEGGAPYAQYRAAWNGKQDQIYGWAKVVNIGDEGWISLNCDKDNDAGDTCGAVSYKVVLNTAVSSSNFTKSQADDHWAWNGNTDGSGIGWVEFTSSASTNWTLAKIGRVVRPQGVFEPELPGLPGTHLFTFTIGFENFTAPKDDVLACNVTRSGGGQTLVLQKTLPNTVRIPPGKESLEYTLQADDPTPYGSLWILHKCRVMSDLTGVACVADPDCMRCVTGQCNVTGKTCVTDADCIGTASCDVFAIPKSCRPNIAYWKGKRVIYPHPNAWTGLEATGGDQTNWGDWLRAVSCYTGELDVHFKNAEKCDYVGDSTVAMKMNAGIPIEGNCGNGTDDDGDTRIDCDDSDCLGLAYSECRIRKPIGCFRGNAGDGVPDCNDPAYISGEFCCTNQTNPATGIQNIVDGLECRQGSADDGYFDCECASQAAFDASPTDDCVAPGAQSGDLCCDAANDAVIL